MARHAMNSPDAAWLRMDRPTNLMVITSVLWFDAPLPLDAVRAIFRDRLVAPFPRFRQRADAGGAGRRPAWVDDDQFDIGLHIHHLALPAPGDRAVLQDVVSDLAVRPLDPSRPLWEVHLLDGYGKGCALVVRMHHAIADGILLARVMMSLTDGAEAVHSRAPRPRTRQLPLPGPLGAAAGAARAGVSIAREAVGVARHPERVPGVARAAAQDGRTLLKLLLPASDPDSAVHGELVPAHHVAWTEPVPLERVRETGRRHGATINDVVVAAVAGAVGSSLRRNGDAVPAIHALVPFNLRPLDGELDPRLGNRFGLVLLPLPTNVHGRSARIHAAHEQMLAIKRSNEGPLSYGILGLIGLTPAMVEARLVDFFSAKGSMVLTNVPGPRRPVTLAGVPVGGVLVWAPCSGKVGMSVSVFSYAGRLTVGFLVDDALAADPAELARDVHRELCRKPAPRPRRTADDAPVATP